MPSSSLFKDDSDDNNIMYLNADDFSDTDSDNPTVDAAESINDEDEFSDGEFDRLVASVRLHGTSLKNRHSMDGEFILMELGNGTWPYQNTVPIPDVLSTHLANLTISSDNNVETHPNRTLYTVQTPNLSGQVTDWYVLCNNPKMPTNHAYSARALAQDLVQKNGSMVKAIQKHKKNRKSGKLVYAVFLGHNPGVYDHW